MSYVTSDQLRFYLYRSASKIDMLYGQVQQPDKSKKIIWKFELPKLLSRESETETSPPGIDQKLQTVVRHLEEQGLIGSLEADLPYVRATLPVRWGLYDDSGRRDPTMGTMVYFGHTGDDVLFGMAGSSFNVEGMYGITSTSSRSVTPYVVDFLLQGIDLGERPPGFKRRWEGPIQHVYEGIALANYYLRGPEQTVEFVAKVIVRDQQCRLRPWEEKYGLVVLATPLYVAQTELMSVDNDDCADQLGKPIEPDGAPPTVPG